MLCLRVTPLARHDTPQSLRMEVLRDEYPLTKGIVEGIMEVS